MIRKLKKYAVKSEPPFASTPKELEIRNLKKKYALVAAFSIATFGLRQLYPTTIVPQIEVPNILSPMEEAKSPIEEVITVVSREMNVPSQENDTIESPLMAQHVRIERENMKNNAGIQFSTELVRVDASEVGIIPHQEFSVIVVQVVQKQVEILTSALSQSIETVGKVTRPFWKVFQDGLGPVIKQVASAVNENRVSYYWKSAVSANQAF